MIVGEWHVVEDEDNSTMLGIFAQLGKEDSLIYLEGNERVQVEFHETSVEAAIWEERGTAHGVSHRVSLPKGYDSNVAHCAVLVALANLGVASISLIAQRTARAVERAFQRREQLSTAAR